MKEFIINEEDDGDAEGSSRTPIDTLQVIGIVVFNCPRCPQKHVTNIESIKSGIQIFCKCGYERRYRPGSEVKVRVAECSQQALEQNDSVSHILPLDEYKAQLANMIVTGRKPKAKKAKDNSVEIRNCVEALINMGYKQQDALQRVNAVIGQGVVAEADIIKTVLAQ